MEKDTGGIMNAIWKLQDAKSQFSKLVEAALQKGPQYVTRRGTEAVVIISSKEYEKLTSHKPRFKDFLLSCPKLDQEFEFDRHESNYSAARVPIMNPWRSPIRGLTPMSAEEYSGTASTRIFL
jgi:antitoxin Phd